MTTLSTKGLTIGYGRNTLFEGQDLFLPAGQLVCFMGPNGIGKSTLIRTLAGIQPPLDGSIHYPDPEKDLPHQIAVVLTDRIAAAHLSVEEVIIFGRYPYLPWSLRLDDRDRDIIEQAIELLRLKPLLEKKLFELSDGQLQMAMIARALVQDTPIILLDEPTAHLDLNNRVEIMNLLRQVAHEKNKAVLIATHELDLALQTADLIWLTQTNKTIVTGLPEDLVLDGSFDQVFRFKGFDLKSGKVTHPIFRRSTLQLRGNEYYHLWTRNALERMGYEVTDTGDVTITVEVYQEKLKWHIGDNNSTHEADTIEALLRQLEMHYA